MPSQVVLTSEELRAKAVSLSHRRGKSVAQRRILWRWMIWVLWSWILPIIGLATVLTAVASMSLVYYLGPETAIHTTQSWLSERFGVQPHIAKPDTHSPEKQPEKSDAIGSKTLPDQNNGLSNSETIVNSTSNVILQFDRNIALQKLNATSPNTSSTLTNNANSVLLQKGTQP